MSNLVEMKSRVAAPNGVYYVFALLLDLKSRKIDEVHAVAGESSDFGQVDLNSPLPEFQAWQKQMIFSGKQDDQATGDLQRFLGSHFKNMEWAEKLVKRVVDGDMGGLEYELALEMEVALGQKNLVFQTSVMEQQERPQEAEAPADEKKGGKSAGADDGPPEQEEDLSGQLPLVFVISPFAGVSLSRLGPGSRIRVRFAQERAGRSADYIKRQGLDKLDGAPEISATIRSIGKVKRTGEVLVQVDLPGGERGFIKEDNRDLKIKTSDSKKANRPANFYKESGGNMPLLALGLIASLLLLGAVLFFVLFS